MTARVTEADIIKGLRQNPEFTKIPDDYNIHVIRPFIPQLIECVDVVGVNVQASWNAVARVIAMFIQKLLDGKYLQDTEEDFRRRYGLTPQFLQEHNVSRVAPITRQLEREQQAYERSRKAHDKWLKEQGLTEAEYILSRMELNETARQLYGAGQLTLGKLLVVQPDRLLPEPHCLFIWNDGFPD